MDPIEDKIVAHRSRYRQFVWLGVVLTVLLCVLVYIFIYRQGSKNSDNKAVDTGSQVVEPKSLENTPNSISSGVGGVSLPEDPQ